MADVRRIRTGVEAQTGTLDTVVRAQPLNDAVDLATPVIPDSRSLPPTPVEVAQGGSALREKNQCVGQVDRAYHVRSADPPTALERPSQSTVPRTPIAGAGGGGPVVVPPRSILDREPAQLGGFAADRSVIERWAHVVAGRGTQAPVLQESPILPSPGARSLRIQPKSLPQREIGPGTIAGNIIEVAAGGRVGAFGRAVEIGSRGVRSRARIGFMGVMRLTPAHPSADEPPNPPQGWLTKEAGLGISEIQPLKRPTTRTAGDSLGGVEPRDFRERNPTALETTEHILATKCPPYPYANDLTVAFPDLDVQAPEFAHLPVPDFAFTVRRPEVFFDCPGYTQQTVEKAGEVQSFIAAALGLEPGDIDTRVRPADDWLFVCGWITPFMDPVEDMLRDEAVSVMNITPAGLVNNPLRFGIWLARPLLDTVAARVVASTRAFQIADPASDYVFDEIQFELRPPNEFHTVYWSHKKGSPERSDRNWKTERVWPNAGEIAITLQAKHPDWDPDDPSFARPVVQIVGASNSSLNDKPAAGSAIASQLPPQILSRDDKRIFWYDHEVGVGARGVRFQGSFSATPVPKHPLMHISGPGSVLAGSTVTSVLAKYSVVRDRDIGAIAKTTWSVLDTRGNVLGGRRVPPMPAGSAEDALIEFFIPPGTLPAARWSCDILVLVTDSDGWMGTVAKRVEVIRAWEP